MLPKTNACKTNFDESKYDFFDKNDELREKYDENWDKVSNNIKKGFDSEDRYNEKYLKTELKFYEGKMKTIFTVIRWQRRFSMHLSIHNID